MTFTGHDPDAHPDPRAAPEVFRYRSGPSRGVLIGLVAALVLVLGLGAGGAFYWTRLRTPPIQAVPTATPSAVTGWSSGVWTGGTWGTNRVAAFAGWRGSPADTAVTYPAYGTWQELAEKSEWHVSVFDGFAGTLVYGLPLLPKDAAPGALAEVAAGRHDSAFTAVAATLARHQRSKSVIRVGLEANGDWFPWGAGKPENTPELFKAAFRRVATLMKAKLPGCTIVFDISAGAAIHGQTDRLDPLTKLYPGDDVVDVIGVDHYDHYQLVAPTQQRFDRALKPAKAAGLQDTLDFARAHRKRFAVPEWGLTSTAKRGGGDNDFFIYAMYSWFAANSADLAFENYFNEPEAYIGSSIWDQVQNPRAAAEYRALWGARPRPKAALTPSGSPSAAG